MGVVWDVESDWRFETHYWGQEHTELRNNLHQWTYSEPGRWGAGRGEEQIRTSYTQVISYSEDAKQKRWRSAWIYGVTAGIQRNCQMSRRILAAGLGLFVIFFFILICCCFMYVQHNLIPTKLNRIQDCCMYWWWYISLIWFCFHLAAPSQVHSWKIQSLFQAVKIEYCYKTFYLKYKHETCWEFWTWSKPNQTIWLLSNTEVRTSTWLLLSTVFVDIWRNSSVATK